MDVDLQQLIPYGISLLLGLIVGLQREHAKGDLAGFRTFPLITVFGTIVGSLADETTGWTLVGGFVAIATVLLIGNMQRLGNPDHEIHAGTTTEMAVLVMFGVGALLALGHTIVGVTLGGAVAVLLQFKPELHGFAERLADRDVRAIMQFVLLSAVVLPVVPDQTVGPYDVINPRQVWWMVVLIVGLSLSGYIVYRFVGKRAGVALGGVLGGVISSTATTVSYSRLGKSDGDGPGNLVRSVTIVILIACSVLYLRIIAAVAVVSSQLVATAWAPLTLLFAVSGGMALVAYLRGVDTIEELPEQKNPSELKTALVFGAAYAIVLVGLAAAKDVIGDQGLYGVAALSGLTHMDAITLSAARLVEQGGVGVATAWRMIVIGAIANLGFKLGLVAVLGGRRLLARLAPYFGLHAVAAGLLLLFWP